MGWQCSAQRGSTVLVVCAISCNAICNNHDVGFVIYLLYCVRVYMPKKLSHITYHGFPKHASPKHVANLILPFLFADGSCAITSWETSKDILLLLH